MMSRLGASLSWLLAALVVGVYLVFIAQFLVVSLARDTYPFELEWFEGQTIDNAWRIVHGLPIYGPPDATFAASYYPPLFYLVTLPFIIASGWALWAARLVSWLATVGAGLVAVRLVRRSGGSWAAIVFTLGSMAAFYAPTGHWYDLARVDALETLLVVAGVSALAALDGPPGTARLWLAVAFLTLAVLTKQTAVLFCIAALFFVAMERDWRRLATLAIAFSVLGIATAAALWIWTEGWIIQVVTVPRHHWTSYSRLWKFAWSTRALLPLLILAAAGVRRPAGRLLLVQTAAALVVAALSYIKVGGGMDSALPAIFLAATAAGLAAPDAWRALDASRTRRALRATGLVVLVITPLWCDALPPDLLDWIPTAEDRRQARELWEDMRAQPGEFLAFNYSFVSTVLRGRTYPNGSLLYSFAGGYDASTYLRPDVARYPRDFLQAIKEHRFTAIYTNGGPVPDDPIDRLIRYYYAPERSFGEVAVGPDAIRWRQATPRQKWLPKTGMTPRRR